MANLVQKIHKQNHTSRSTFDLSGNLNFTAAPGMLLPIRVDDCLPNSSYTYDFSLFARTLQMVVPTFARVKAHVDTFFVPYRLLCPDYQPIIAGDARGAVGNYDASNAFSNEDLKFPYFSIYDAFPQSTTDGKTLVRNAFNKGQKDAAGIDCNITTTLLLNALGYGVPGMTSEFNEAAGGENRRQALTKVDIASTVWATNNVNLPYRTFAPLQAYQKIYQDFYRNKLWEKEDRGAYYFPYGSSSSTSLSSVHYPLFELRYHDYDKDRFFGMLPDENGILSDGISLYASDALNRGANSSAVFGHDSVPYSDSHLLNADGTSVGSDSEGVFSFGTISSSSSGLSTGASADTLLSPQFSALTLRRAEAFQRFAEITSMSKSDYKHQIQAHFGFTPKDVNSDYCTYVGGFDVPLSVSDIANTSDTNQGYLAGRGTMAGGSSTISFKSNQEHGILMSIFYIVPQIDWSNDFVDRVTMRFNRYDFAIPEFDSLGFEPVRSIDLLCDMSKAWTESDKSFPTLNADIIGYLPRYWYYKTCVDRNSVGFSASSQKTLDFNSYIVSYDKNRILTASALGNMFEAFKSRPTDLDGLFPTNWQSVSDDPFVINCFIKCTASLPLSVDGLPY